MPHIFNLLNARVVVALCCSDWMWRADDGRGVLGQERRARRRDWLQELRQGLGAAVREQWLDWPVQQLHWRRYMQGRWPGASFLNSELRVVPFETTVLASKNLPRVLEPLQILTCEHWQIYPSQVNFNLRALASHLRNWLNITMWWRLLVGGGGSDYQWIVITTGTHRQLCMGIK